jgi:ribokinase
MEGTTKTQPSILVVGSINMDLVLQTTRMPHPGESLIGQNYHYIPGGKGANQAVAAARLGAVVALAGKIGSDANGMKLREHLGAQGISTGCIVVDAESQTGLAVIMLDAAGQNSILVIPGANMDIRKQELYCALSQGHYDAIMLQLEIPQEIVIECCALARRAGIPIVLDAGPAQAFPLEQVRGVEILTPNETETLALTGLEIGTIDEAAYAASVLLARAEAHAVVMKLGEKGALLRVANGATEHFPAQNVEVVDTTAAGDAFTAAMTVRYLETGDLRDAVAYGNLAGALTVTRLGAQPSLPTAAEVEAFHTRIRATCVPKQA